MNFILAKYFRSLLICFLLIGCNTSEKLRKDDKPRRIEILFLGHAQEHHNAREYMPILASALTQNGINITYTEEVKDLNKKNLELYDGVIIYANHEDRHPEQEKALLNYVAEGHAFIPIHCASFCFNESKEYVDLVGGQFKEHGTGTFTANIVDKTHPTMQSFETFSTWDETYVHDKMAEDVIVLMERVEGEHREPWTWVKNYGEGRVFYTAYGHDERTWQNPGFQKLVKEGILWAVSDNVKKNWEEFSKGIPKLEYKEMANIPNYEKRDPAPKYQLPLAPEDSKKLIQVPSGFELELFASEPDIINPIAMNWDERGRLWVIETVDYPNTVRDEKGLGDDKVKILEDTDGDGKADKVTVFADKLNIPTSFTFANGGVIISQAPHFIFLKDTDGDDKADTKEVIIDGWGTFDTHAGPSNLQNGIDNKIYGVLGYSGFKGTIFGKDEEFRQGVYRFDKKLRDFEFLTSTSNNTWGLGITEDHSIFASTANNTHSVFLGIPNASFTGVEGISTEGSIKIDGHYAMQPITPNVRQVDVFGGFTAAAGHHFYTARDYPQKYWNKVAFVCEPTGGLVHIAKIEKIGAGYVEKDGGNLFAGSDEWVSPVEAKVGPDGSVWVADWYNFIVQHNPTPRADRGGYDAENGKGNAYVNPLRDKSRGRIWRVVPKSSTDYKSISIDKNEPGELLKALSNDNMFWRLTAQRLLVERGNTDVLKDLYKLVNNAKVDQQGMNPAALHALWTIQGLNALTSDKEAKNVVAGALYHAAPSVRKAAVEILPKSELSDEALLKSGVLYDENPQVQMAALLYFSERPSSQAIGKLLYDLSKQENIVHDNWLSKAVYIAASRHAKGFMEQFEKSDPGFSNSVNKNEQRESQAYNDSDWKTMRLPQTIENAGLQIDGIIWFRKTINISKAMAGKSGVISLGPIDDSDIVYINGKKVGETEQRYDYKRVYKIPAGVLSAGANTIAVRVEDTGGEGGIYGNKNEMFLKQGSYTVSLDGTWKYQVEIDFSKTSNNIFKNTSIAEVFAKAYKGSMSSSEGLVDGSAEKATVIQIKTVKNEMKYDISEFVVQAETPVEIVLENVDFMQHNLVIVAPGQKEKVGAAADRMAADPTGAEKDYIPEMGEVLYATALVNPEEKVVLRFTAPDKPGMYPFICTFPGHWRIMQGVMKVVASN
ncbi:PVC-type heme-binding CxxCH protein [uncultured Kriegella sp.]|uniref:PVC-type heme-binding CxxCH protein n=1 Tax=uncultured Kriegella sp. TaxID=1798910 RepID=UPI0030D7C04F